MIVIFKTLKNEISDIFKVSDWSDVYKITDNYFHPDGISEVIIKFIKSEKL